MKVDKILHEYNFKKYAVQRRGKVDLLDFLESLTRRELFEIYGKIRNINVQE
jgi:hypothetical protein